MTNVSGSVVKVYPTESSGVATATYYQASATSVSQSLFQQTVAAGCSGTECTLRPSDLAILSGSPPAEVYVQVVPEATITGQIASILGALADRRFTNPSMALRQSALACAEGLDDLTSPGQLPEDEIRQILTTYPQCNSTYNAIYGDTRGSSSVADDVIRDLESKVRGNFVDEFLQGLARAHPR